MSGYDAGSLFVRIVPTAEGFGQTAAAEIRKQAPAVQAAAQQAVSGRVPYAGSYSAAVKEDSERNLAALKANRQAVTEVSAAQRGATATGASFSRSLGVAGVAAFAGYQAAQELSKALRVEGYEAQTTEGRFRNLGAELLQGNIVGGLEALLVHTDSATERLHDLAAAAETTPVDLRNFALATGEASAAAEAHADALDHQEKLAGRAGITQVELATEVHKSAAEMLDAAGAATALARALETSVSAADDVEGALARAGSEAGAFGERVRGPGAVSTESGRPRGAPSRTDSTATSGTGNAVAASLAARTKGLQDDLVLARREAAQAAQIEKNLSEVAEGAAARHQAAVEANTRVVQVEQEIDARAAQAAKEAQATRDRAAREAEAARKEAARLAAEEARAATAAAKAEIDRRLALDDLRLEQAGLTKGLGDDRKALDNKIDDLKALRQKTKQYSSEWIDYSRQITDLRLTLQNLGSRQKDSQGLTGAGLFAEAAREFGTFGSNVTGQPGGILSGQDARGAFGLQVTQDLAGQVQGAQLTTQQQMLAALTSIDSRLAAGTPHTKPTEGKVGSLIAVGAAQVAAAFNYGAN